MTDHEAQMRHAVAAHEPLMRRAMSVADTARLRARPNPWVGAVLVCTDGSTFEGATREPGGNHAEREALEAALTAGADTQGATLVCTLEPCSHTGRTPPCTDALIEAGIATVVVGITDPDQQVNGRGLEILRDAGVNVVSGVCAGEVSQQLAAYIHHRRTGRPFVMLKMATTLDARTTIPDGPRWITGESARVRVHRLRAESDAIVVGAGTVRTDDPELTVRHVEGPSPRRIVLSASGKVPAHARVHPCTVWSGDLEDLLDNLGDAGALQVMVEGGPTVATAFHRRGLVDRYVFHVAPTLTGRPDAPGVFTDGEAELSAMHMVQATRYGDDVEIVLEPANTSQPNRNRATP